MLGHKIFDCDWLPNRLQCEAKAYGQSSWFMRSHFMVLPSSDDLSARTVLVKQKIKHPVVIFLYAIFVCIWPCI